MELFSIRIRRTFQLVSTMLGHTNVRTTQVYAKVVDAKKEEATKTIKLDLPYC